jgi:hypothetical protein
MDDNPIFWQGGNFNRCLIRWAMEVRALKTNAMLAAAMLRLMIVSALVALVLEAQGGGAWSLPVSGVRARFAFERGDASKRTRIIRVFLELRNTSDFATPIYLFYDPLRSIKAQLYDQSGVAVSISPHYADITLPDPFLICLPHNSTLRLDVTAIGYGVLGRSAKDTKALIGLTSGVWAIKETDSSEYFLGGTFFAAKPKNPAKERTWSGALEIPKANVDVLE